MNIPSSQLQICLDHANSIADAFALLPHDGGTARSVGLLKGIFEKTFDAKVMISVIDLDSSDSLVLGFCMLLNDNTVEIGLASGLDDGWKRFVLCKELFHIALDRDEYKSINLFDHVEDITLAFPDDSSKPDLPVVAEFLAEVGALELLFPYRERVGILKQPEVPDFLQIATRYNIPKLFAEKYLSPSYMKSLADFSRG